MVASAPSVGYEPEIEQVLLELIEPGSVVFDVQAHVGVLTIAMRGRVASGRVVAFEPAPRTVSTLRRHIEMNGLAGVVEIIAAATSDSEGMTEFHTHRESMAASLSHEALELSPETFGEPPATVRVETVTIDGVAARMGVTPDLVKIDVEGAELFVLRGMPRLLADPDVRIVCEIHPAQLAANGVSVEELESFAALHGRRIEPIDVPNAAGIFHAQLRSTLAR